MSEVHSFEEEDFSGALTGKVALRIIAQIKPYYLRVIGFMLAIGLVSFLDSYFTFLSKRIIDEGIAAKNMVALRQILIQYGALILVQAAAVFIFIYFAGILGERVQYDLRKKLFNHLQRLSLSYYNITPVGWIMSRVTSDSERVASLVTWRFLDFIWAGLNIITATYFMIKINWRLGLIVVAIIPVLVVVAGQFKKKIIIEFRQVRKINSKITGSYNENITGVRVIKAFNREKQNMLEFGELTDQMYEAGFRAAWLSALFLPVVMIISAFALGSVIWYGGLQAQIGGMTIGGIQAFISYINFMIWPIQDLARVYAELQRSIASAERIFSLLDTNPEIYNLPDAADTSSLAGDIVFDDVCFYYEEDEEVVLENFSLDVTQGETIALVGPTGGGKSTIVNLLCRFFEPRSGRILINGKDYTELTLESIQSRIGIVLQTPHLFSGTIEENIRYGKLDATVDEIVQASKLAGAHEFILTLEKGYQEDVGEGGNLLSVGQKQLISLARAVLRRPDIFIMDEATSSVDTITEAMIQRGMENLMEKRTSIIIAHRLSTIRKADRILFIKDGAIAEVGSHRELLKKKGLYYRLYTQQFRKDMALEFSSSSLLSSNS
ncbi:MAG: ABC transporter ATP-binding protein [Anaerolineales bacterium]